MATEPACPAPPCLLLSDFISACLASADAVRIYSIWMEPSLHQKGFYSRAHFVADDARGNPIRCSQRVFDQPRNLAYIEAFLAKLRLMLAIT